MDTQKTIAWIKTSAIAAVGGGVAGAFAAAMDPTKYQFPHDFGSGKLWKYFGMGALLTFGGLVLRSPLGQRAMTAYKESQAQIQQSKEDIAHAKAQIQESQTHIQESQENIAQAKANMKTPPPEA